MILRLTKTQRVKLLAGECPGIAGQGDCPVHKGEAVKLAPGLTLTVLRVDRNPSGWKLHYELRDRRDAPRLLRRTPPVVPPKADPRAPNEDEVRRAARESSYTTSPASAITSAAEAVDEATQDRFTEEARRGFAAQLERERREREARTLDGRLRMVQHLAAEKGVDITRKLASIEARIASTERDVGRDKA